jgi:excisionase family DNA binding protein
VSDRRRIALELPNEAVEAIAERAAEIVVEQLRTEAQSEYLTVAQAAAFIGAKRQRIYDLLSDGRLRRYGTDHARLVSRAELVAYVENSDGDLR